MIGYVKGNLVEADGDCVVIENSNVGYNILVPQSVMEKLPPTGSVIKLYTYMHVREDAILLFGFLSRDELEVFKLLLSVSGVGPKGALGILSVLSCSELRLAVHSMDAGKISKAPGIGSKTAQRIIIDLKDKLHLEDAWETEEKSTASPSENRVEKEAVEALTALGYSASEALSAVKQVTITDKMSVEECLKLSLKYL